MQGDHYRHPLVRGRSTGRGAGGLDAGHAAGRDSRRMALAASARPHWNYENFLGCPGTSPSSVRPGAETGHDQPSGQRGGSFSGRVRLTAGCEAEALVLTVTDHGPGFAAEGAGTDSAAPTSRPSPARAAGWACSSSSTCCASSAARSPPATVRAAVRWWLSNFPFRPSAIGDLDTCRMSAALAHRRGRSRLRAHAETLVRTARLYGGHAPGRRGPERAACRTQLRLSRVVDLKLDGGRGCNASRRSTPTTRTC